MLSPASLLVTKIVGWTSETVKPVAASDYMPSSASLLGTKIGDGTSETWVLSRVSGLNAAVEEVSETSKPQKMSDGFMFVAWFVEGFAEKAPDIAYDHFSKLFGTTVVDGTIDTFCGLSGICDSDHQ